MRIKFDQYAGQEIIVCYQQPSEKISLISAKTDGVVTGYSTQLLQDIKCNGLTASMNANYWVMATGMALGVRCGLDEWSVPRQGAWYFYALHKSGQSVIGIDNDFWSTPEDMVFACSPALILLYHGATVNYLSPGAGSSKSGANTQSMLLRLSDGSFALAVCKGRLTPQQCRAWAMSLYAQDLILMDSGGSSCLQADGGLLMGTSRKISNALCFYKEGDDPMTLKGIDISNWQGNIDLTKIDFDFMIAKATEGTHFVDKYCDKFIQTAKGMGKLWGFYHFARPTNSAEEEAEYFVRNCRSYFGEGIPVLDWEAENKNDVQWALRWLNKVKEMTGVKPMIYMSESVVNAYDWSPVVAGDYGLWVAKYRDAEPDYNYDMSMAGNAPKVRWWPGYAMWQWTSTGKLDGYTGSLDCDIFYGDKKAWLAYVQSKPIQTEPAPPVDPDEDLRAMLDAVTAKNRILEAELEEYKKRIERAAKALEGKV